MATARPRKAVGVFAQIVAILVDTAVREHLLQDGASMGYQQQHPLASLAEGVSDFGMCTSHLTPTVYLLIRREPQNCLLTCLR